MIDDNYPHLQKAVFQHFQILSQRSWIFIVVWKSRNFNSKSKKLDLYFNLKMRILGETKVKNWQYGNLEKWKSSNLEKWKSGNLEIWKTEMCDDYNPHLHSGLKYSIGVLLFGFIKIHVKMQVSTKKDGKSPLFSKTLFLKYYYKLLDFCAV